MAQVKIHTPEFSIVEFAINSKYTAYSKGSDRVLYVGFVYLDSTFDLVYW